MDTVRIALFGGRMVHVGKKGLWFVLLAVISFTLSCKKDRREELFELNHFVDFTIPPGLSTFDTHIFTISPLTSQLETKLMAFGRDRDEVTSIESKYAFLASVFQDVNLDFIHRVAVYIYNPFNPVEKIEFCYLDPVPFRNKTSITLFPGISDVSEWMDRGFFGIEIRLDFREVSPTLVDMRLEFDFRVMGE